MNEMVRTAIFAAAALGLAGAAWLSQPTPPKLAQFSDQGEPFYPEFTDPLAAASLEVIDYAPASGTARPFKVRVEDGRWTIPSHYDYPADGEDRLARTASAVIDLRKDIVQSDRVQDHEPLGVIDPLDETTGSLLGRGQRVTLRDESGSSLADFIIGRSVDGKPGYRFVRIPEKKHTYAVKLDVDLSTRFADWIDADLLDVDAATVTSIRVNDYSVDEVSGTVVQSGTLTLVKAHAAGPWEMQDQPPATTLVTVRIDAMTAALARLKITGVRPKPDSLSGNLRTREGLSIDLPTQLSLQSKGFFISPDGRLLSNEGEMSVGTSEGVLLSLRFGEVLYGEGPAVSAGHESGDDNATDSGPSDGQAENRYLFITASFEESLLPPRPAPPDDTDADDEDEAGEDYQAALADWERQVLAGREKASQLNDRFAPWYYVISATDFKSIRLTGADLLKPAENPATADTN